MRLIRLTADQIARERTQLPNWNVAGDQIEREFKFADFARAMEFVNRVAESAERASHHPDIDIRYNRVKLVLSTHDAAGLTAIDFELARGIDGLVG